MDSSHADGPRVDFKRLKVWQKSVDLCHAIYTATAGFPPDERFGLTAQLRRAAVSIASNLAEEYGRGSRRDYRQFVRIARGSACEVETQVILAERLGFLPAEECRRLLGMVREILCMLNGLIRSLDG